MVVGYVVVAATDVYTIVVVYMCAVDFVVDVYVGVHVRGIVVIYVGVC